MTGAPGTDQKAISPGAFRSLMSEFPSGVTVVTAADEGRPYGMTCSALCSLTVAPATLLVCLRAESLTLAALLRGGTFAVNVLHSKARSVAETFGTGNGVPERFDLVRWSPGPSGPHLPHDAHAIADCRVSGTADGGTHVVVFGEVFDVTQRSGHDPLLYARRSYGSWQE